MNLDKLEKLTNMLAMQEDAILQAKKEWESTFDAVDDGIMMINPDFTVKRVNRSFCRMMGVLHPKDVVGHTCKDVICCEHPTCLINSWMASEECKDGSTLDNFFRCRGKDLWVRYNLVCDEHGDITFIVMILRDVSQFMYEKKRAEHLYSSLRALCDNVPVLMWSKDLKGRFTFVNRATCEKLLGAKDTDEPIGLTDLDFAKREREGHINNPSWHTFGETCIDSDKKTLEAMQPRQFDEYGNIRGEFLYLDVRKAPFYGYDGKLQGTVGCGIDMTAYHALQSALTGEKDKYKKLLDEHYLTDFFNSIPFFVWIKDLDGKFLWVNKYHQKIGKKFEKIIGMSAEDFIKDCFNSSGYDVTQIKEQDKEALSGKVITSDSKRTSIYGLELDLRTLRFSVKNDKGDTIALGGVHIEKDLLEGDLQKRPLIMVLDDREEILAILGAYLFRMGYRPELYKTWRDAKQRYLQVKDSVSLLLLDVKLTDIEGTEIAEKIKTLNPNQKILYISGYVKPDEILEDQFLSKPFDFDTLNKKLSNILSEEKESHD